MKINKYFPFVFIYFFINIVGLPFGLLYTQLLSPVFYSWSLLKHKREFVWIFFLFTLPFVYIHLSSGVEIKSYFVSYILYLTVYVFCFTFYTFLRHYRNIESIFRKILHINFVLCLIAIPIYFTSYSNLFWIEQSLSEGINNFRRLRMFTYEASYYSTLLVPVLFLYLLQLAFSRNTINRWLLLVMVSLPLLLSFSLGVLGGIGLTLAIWYLVFFAKLNKKPRIVFSVYLLAILNSLGLGLLAVFYPENPLFIRLANVFSGNDISGNGRTFEAFQLAYQIAAEKSAWFGIGFGQIKIVGKEIIRNYYMYPADYVISIPNASAETLAILGITGFALRISIEIFLFFRAKVWNNHYQFLLFTFVFIYQFTGSFITNIAEYVIWILAFYNTFPDYNSRKTESVFQIENKNKL
jgi:hypothetical protein